MRDDSTVNTVSQEPFQCGSLECGENTLGGMREYEGIKAVMLDKHGMNILFRSTDDPDRVIEFIESNIRLGEKTR